MDRNKRTARTLTAALCLALLAGCGAETAGESLDADEMHPGWSTVTTDPSAYGITFQNDYNVVDHTAAGEQTPAVALNTQADKVYLKNSRIIGRQDTLYV